MPPHDCSGIIGPLFFCTGDGKYAPFPGLQEMTLPKLDDPKYADAVSIKNAIIIPTQMEMKITHRSARRLYRMIHADVNRIKRNNRHFKRQKEKIRRARLKGDKQ